MEKKLEEVLKNQEILNRNQIIIFKEILNIESLLIKSDKREFLMNYLADLAGLATGELGLVDLFDTIKKKQ